MVGKQLQALAIKLAVNGTPCGKACISPPKGHYSERTRRKARKTWRQVPARKTKQNGQGEVRVALEQAKLDRDRAPEDRRPGKDFSGIPALTGGDHE